MTYFALGAACVAIVGSAVSANESSKASSAAAGRAMSQQTYEGTLQNNLKQQEAAAMQKQAQLDSDKTLNNARYFRGAQVAQNASGGVLVGEGSSQVMLDRTEELAMSDALATLYAGARGAQQAETSGQFALTSSRMNASSAAAQDRANQKAITISATTSILSSALGAGATYSKAQTPKTTK